MHLSLKSLNSPKSLKSLKYLKSLKPRKDTDVTAASTHEHSLAPHQVEFGHSLALHHVEFGHRRQHYQTTSEMKQNQANGRRSTTLARAHQAAPPRKAPLLAESGPMKECFATRMTRLAPTATLGALGPRLLSGAASSHRGMATLKNDESCADGDSVCSRASLAPGCSLKTKQVVESSAAAA